jgi:hypothetical protein
MRSEVNVNARMLSWAIARAGYELQTFIEKFQKLNFGSMAKKTNCKTVRGFF